MPRLHSRYPEVISAAVTQELYDLITQEAKHQKLNVSAVVRNALEEFYDIQYPRMFIINASKKEAADLKRLGFRITEQE